MADQEKDNERGTGTGMNASTGVNSGGRVNSGGGVDSGRGADSASGIQSPDNSGVPKSGVSVVEAKRVTLMQDGEINSRVFDQVFGEVKATINGLQIGDQLLVGTPCDFSGELVEPLSDLARLDDKYLMVHSFNGNYTLHSYSCY